MAVLTVPIFVAALVVSDGVPSTLPQKPQPALIWRASPRPLTIGEALRAAFYGNPDLLNSEDSLLSARVIERGVASTFLPQVTPFFATLRSSETGLTSQAYGVTARQQFSFGPLLEGSAIVTESPPDFPGFLYGTSYILTLRQPLLRGADPVVTREPLRLADRLTVNRTRSLEVQRRQTVRQIYRLYLAMAREQEAERIATERLVRAQELTRFSRARFQAGSVSRLDVLRAEQQEAAAAVERTNASNFVYDFRDQLRRSAGLKQEFEFAVQSPGGLPEGGPDVEGALSGASGRRPEALEAQDRVRDAEINVRIAKSLQLPSLDGVVSYEAIGNGSTLGGSLPVHNSAVLFGFRTDYGLNTGVLLAQRRQAEIDLEVRRRDYQVLQDDIGREVRQAYRRLDTVRSNHRVASENLEVAEMQAKVAKLRFEKGLSTNFDVVDADNLLNSARLLELDSRLSILLAELDCLYASGSLNANSFLRQP